MLFSKRQFQLIFLVLNYGLVIWLIVQTFKEGYLGAFIFLVTLYGIERLLIIVKVIYFSVTSEKLLIGMIRIIGVIFCFDTTLGITIDEEFYFKSKLFSKLMNYTVHYLNLFPLIINFFILADKKKESFPDIVYFIMCIYPPIHVGAVQLTIFIKNHQDTLNIFQITWRFLEGVCRYYCVCACMGELLNDHLEYVVFIILFILYEITLGMQKKCAYYLSCLFQICIFSSEIFLKNGSCNKLHYYLLNNAFQSLLILLIFIIKISTHATVSKYDILVYLTFAITSPFIFSSLNCLIKYFRFGPFELKIKLLQIKLKKKNRDRSPPTNKIQIIDESIKKQFEGAIKVINDKQLASNIQINIKNFLPESTNKDNQQYLMFIVELIKIYSMRRNKNLSFIYFTYYQFEPALRISENQACISVNDKQSLDDILFFYKLILHFEIQKTLNIQIDCENIHFSYEIYKFLIKESQYFKLRFLRISYFPFHFLNCLYKDIITFAAFKKMIFPYLWNNPQACVYDLLEDNKFIDIPDVNFNNFIRVY